MKKQILISITCFLFSFISSSAQYNEWTWMNGSDTLGTSGLVGIGEGTVLGTMGVPDINNTPGFSYENTQWTDLNGNFWMLVYQGFLWKYDPRINMWTWMSQGKMNLGIQGIPSINNYPGQHTFATCTWTDLHNDLWLYAGGSSLLDGNLWKYAMSTGLWTWMKGPGTCSCTAGNYGTRGVSSPTNEPGSREEVAGGSWVDATGNLWVFGGQRAVTPDCSMNTINTNALSDIWKYDMGTNEWTWMSGPDVPNQPAVYGTMGVPSSSNTPGGRWIYAGAKQLNGEFLIFGGGNAIYQGIPYSFNDLWRFNSNTNQWTWLKGPTAINQAGVYGTKCVSSPSNNPGPGFEVRSNWTDDCGNLWLFGSGGSNDLWRYSVHTNEWTWVDGTNIVDAKGVYGKKGVSSPLNIPPGRGVGAGANAWRIGNDFFLFGGGYGIGKSRNDLWRYRPDKPTASFTVDSITGCLPITVNFKSNSTPGCNEIKSYLWNFGDATSGSNDTSTLKIPSHIFNKNGTFTVKLLVINCTGSKDSITQAVTIQTRSAAFSYAASTYCQNGINPLPVFINGSTGEIFTSTTGLSINANTGEINLSKSTPGTYTVTNTLSPNPCPVSPATTIITIVAPPIITVNSPSICTGQTANLIANGGASYSWSTGTTVTGYNTASASPIASTTYTVTGSTNSCTDTAHALVTVFPLPFVIANSDTTIKVGASAPLHVTGGVSYSWSPEDGLNCTNCPNPVVSPTKTTTYTVTAKDVNGCIAADEVTVIIDCGDIFIPNFFTPNNDSQNDLECIYGNCVESMLFAIYDRWGEKVFETSDKQQCWDGTYKGKLLDAAIFVYYLKATFNTGKEISKKGNISLIR
jgi:gliding motility-associated-like protein